MMAGRHYNHAIASLIGAALLYTSLTGCFEILFGFGHESPNLADIVIEESSAGFSILGPPRYRTAIYGDGRTVYRGYNTETYIHSRWDFASDGRVLMSNGPDPRTYFPDHMLWGPQAADIADQQKWRQPVMVPRSTVRTPVPRPSIHAH